MHDEPSGRPRSPGWLILFVSRAKRSPPHPPWHGGESRLSDEDFSGASTKWMDSRPGRPSHPRWVRGRSEAGGTAGPALFPIGMAHDNELAGCTISSVHGDYLMA